MKEQILVKFGKRVRKERLKKKLSQEQLAEIAGVHRTYIGMVERAEKNITLLNIEKIAIALDIKVPELFDNDDNK
jgi:transcriptional regulator with XRE-family HTH domain